jgi:ATP-dependent Clp protease ATP-binding subunit ClpA
MNGYNFTERVRKVLAMAREEAAALHHEYVGTEHELLGLLREGEGIAATALRNLGVDLDALRDSVFDVVKRGTSRTTTGPDLPYTSRAKKTLELAMSEARELKHDYVGTEHLLMGLIREEKGIAAQLLKSFGVDVENARAEILRIIEESDLSAPAHAKPKTNTLRAVATPDSIPQYAERLRSVIAAAHEVAVRQKSAQVTTIHAAIALLEHRQGMANAALDSFDFSRPDALAALHRLVPTGTGVVGPEDVVTMSGELSTVLQSLDARAHTRSFAPGTHHLLLGILHTSPEVAGVFAEQSITEENVRERINRISG